MIVWFRGGPFDGHGMTLEEPARFPLILGAQPGSRVAAVYRPTHSNAYVWCPRGLRDGVLVDGWPERELLGHCSVLIPFLTLCELGEEEDSWSS